MNITLFNKKYWVRRFGEQRNVRGYLTTGHEDFIASLNVHPASESRQALPEGERRQIRLEGHGTDRLIASNEETGVKGDLLYYHGNWYECVSAQEWDHTLLSHINYQFVLVPPDGSQSIDLDEPPETDPNTPTPAYEPEIQPATESELGGVIVEGGSGLTVDGSGNLAVDGASEDEIRELLNDHTDYATEEEIERIFDEEGGGSP